MLSQNQSLEWNFKSTIKNKKEEEEEEIRSPAT